MHQSEVCIVVCTRNRAERLRGTLESLGRLKTSRPWEALVVDNASTDDTHKIIAECASTDSRIRYMRVEQVGLGAARDAAWRATQAPLISFTDDDCYLASDFIDQVAQAFDDFPDVGAIGGRILLHDPTDARVTIDEREEQVLYRSGTVLEAGELQGANLSFRRSALVRSGGFDFDLGAGTPFPAEDIDAVAAVMWAGFDVRYDPRPTVFHHHGRKDADVAALRANYDYGRGAYWAKFILRSDTRLVYLAKWWQLTRQARSRYALGRVHRELNSAFRYALKRRRYGSVALAFPPVTVALSYVYITTADYLLRRLLRHFRGRR
jgi:glycosyltransferase involved in cell wall biosynthesis